MKRTFLFILISGLLFATPSFAESTQNVLSACKSFLNDTAYKEDKIFLPNTYDSGVCWGAFMVVQKMINFYTTDKTQPIFGVCVPEEVRRAQLISVFVKYAEDNPQLLHMDFTSNVINSLQNAFPCNKGNKNKIRIEKRR